MDLVALRAALESVANADEAPDMSRYLRDQFRFLGVRSPALRQAAKPTLAAGKEATGDELVAFAQRCWAEPEREFQYVGALLLRRWIAALEPRHLDDLRSLITSQSWWDTVDSLAPWSVGPLVRANPQLVSSLDHWIEDDNIWVARSALLHQLSYKGDTDGERLFRYVSLRAGDSEFFIRKAIGWALRQYARTEPERVRTFVEANRDQLSPLSVREALKHLDSKAR